MQEDTSTQGQPPEKQAGEEKIVQPLPSKKLAIPNFVPMAIALLLVLAGIFSGYRLSQGKLAGKVGIIKTEKTAGSTDTKTFKDQAEGVLEKAGDNGEGTHKLIRDPKRPDQTVYLTSSVVNLEDFVGKKVRVWGETFAAQRAGWLMDVGRVELLQ
jgi:hypothetical protein